MPVCYWRAALPPAPGPSLWVRLFPLASPGATAGLELYMETSGARAHDYLYAIPGAAIGGGLPVALGADCRGNGCAGGSRVDSRGLPYRFQEGDVEERPPTDRGDHGPEPAALRRPDHADATGKGIS